MSKKNNNYSPITVIDSKPLAIANHSNSIDLLACVNNNYSPITIIDSKQLASAESINKYLNGTDLSAAIYTNLNNNSFIEEMVYQRSEIRDKYGDKYGECRWPYTLIKSYFKGSGDLDDNCLCTNNNGRYFRRFVDQIFGVVPVIPYTFVSEMVKYDSFFDTYILGHYPSIEITLDQYDNDNERDLLKKTKEKFSIPFILNDKLIVKDYDVYLVKNSNKKVIKYDDCFYGDDRFYEIEPVTWRKYGDYLVCTHVLFESPVHIKNDYTNNIEVKSFDDTFLKWYIDNVFTKDLFKYTDCTFMEEQMMKGLDEDIDSKLKEIERLKEIKSDLITRLLITRLDNKEKTNISVQENKINEADEDLKVKTKKYK